MIPALPESQQSPATLTVAKPETTPTTEAIPALPLSLSEVAERIGYSADILRRVHRGPYSESDLDELRLACRRVWNEDFDWKVEIEYRIKYHGDEGCGCAACLARRPKLAKAAVV